MASKYEEIYDDYLKNGLKFKKYYEISNLNYHNTQIGIYPFRKKKELIYFYLNIMNFSYIQEQYDKCLTKFSIGRALSYALN